MIGIQEKGEKVEKMTTKDVYMFPIIASGTLFSIYIIVKVCLRGMSV